MFALKNLLRRKIRTLLSIVGIGVGVASIVAFTSISYGLRYTINQYAIESGAHLAAWDSRVPDPLASRLTKEDIQKLAKLDNVDAVDISAMLPSFMPGRPGLFVFGRDPEGRLIRSYQNKDLRGRLLKTRGEVMLGDMASNMLKKGLNDSITLFGKPYTIVGIVKTGVTWEDGAAIAHMDVVREALKIPEGCGMMAFLFLRDPSKWEQTVRLAPQLGMNIQRVENLAASFDQLQYVDAFVWVISLAAIVVGAVGVLNTLLMSVSERVREIGTLRAFGWSRGMVVRFILLEGLIISVLGGISGVLMGYVGAETLLRLAPQGFISAKYDTLLFVKGLVVAVGVGVIGSMYPAYQASRLPPAEALRYE